MSSAFSEKSTSDDSIKPQVWLASHRLQHYMDENSLQAPNTTNSSLQVQFIFKIHIQSLMDANSTHF